jgi:hypothetical protein
MKALLTIILLLTILPALATPTKVISEVCDYDYIEGVSLKSMNGHDMRVCHHRDRLPNAYLTDSRNKCDYRYSAIKETEMTKLCVKSE